MNYATINIQANFRFLNNVKISIKSCIFVLHDVSTVHCWEWNLQIYIFHKYEYRSIIKLLLLCLDTDTLINI